MYYRHSPAVLLTIWLIVLGGCATEIPVVAIPPAPGSSFDPASITVPDARPLAEATVFPGTVPPPPSAGERNAFGGVTPAPLAAAWAAQQRNDTESALNVLAQIHESEDPLNAWLASFVRVQVLLTAGRAAEAEAALPELSERELSWIGHDLNSQALRGEVLVWIGDYEAARHVLSTVLYRTEAWRLPVKYGGPPTNLGQIVALTTAQLRAQTALGALFFLQGDAKSARSWASAAEARYNDVHYVAQHPLYGPHLPTHYDSFYGRALNLGVLAAAETQLGNDQAVSKHAAALRAVDSIGWNCGIPFVTALQAQALLASDRPKAALTAADAATRAATDRGCTDFIWRVEALRGEALFAGGREDEALDAFIRAQHAVTAVTGGLSGDRAKLRFGIGKETIVRRLAFLFAKRDELSKLYEAMERGRARAFVDLLSQQDLGAAADDSDALAIRDLESRLKTARLAALAPRAEPVLQSDLDTLLSERQARLNSLARRFPHIAELMAVTEPKVTDIQAALRPDGALLYALPLSFTDTVRWLEIRPQSLSLRQGSVTGRDLGQLLNRFVRSGLQGRSGDQAEMLTRIESSLGLSDLSADVVYVVPSGPLYRVPWGVALPELTVSVLPTAAMLPRLNAAHVMRRGAVIVGDPDFGSSLPQLPGAREEARRIGTLHGVSPLIGTAATESAVREQVGSGVNILHLATHGTFDALRPLNSAVFLTSRKLTAADLFARPLAADLVILSACETGLGKSVAGDDYLGLSRSFYFGGVRTLLHSLWPVADAPTRRFMTEFHESAKSGDLGTAWRQATDALNQDGFPPFVAGAFVLSGALRQ